MTIALGCLIGGFWGCSIDRCLSDSSARPIDERPLVFIARHEIRDGKVDAYRAYFRELTAAVEANEPRMIGWGGFLDPEARQVTGIQIHPDQASLETHMEVLRDKIGESFDFLGGLSIELLGEVSPDLLANMRRFGGPALQLTTRSEYLDGFVRSTQVIGKPNAAVK